MARGLRRWPQYTSKYCHIKDIGNVALLLSRPNDQRNSINN